MSILKASYQLGKKFANYSNKFGLADLFGKLHLTGQGNFGYQASGCSTQFLGYLSSEGKLNGGNAYNAVTSILSDEEYNLFYTFHRQICEINKRCVASFISSYPVFSDFLDVYNEDPIKEGNLIDGINLINTDEANKLIQLFSKHIAFSLAEMYIEKLPIDKKNEDSNIQKALWLENCMWQFSPMNDFFNQYVKKILNKEKITEVSKCLMALLCIKDSLFNLDQLLFQEAVSSKPAILSRENIIDTGFASGHNITLTVQFIEPTIEEIFVRDHISLCLLKDVYTRQNNPQLVRVEQSSSEFDVESGTIFQLEMREVDENLNSFTSILHFVEHYKEREY